MSKSLVTETKDQHKPITPYFYVFYMWKKYHLGDLKWMGLADFGETVIHKITKEKNKSYIDWFVDFCFLINTIFV